MRSPKWLSRRLWIFLGAVALAFTGACTNGVGGSCDTDTDCNHGLICVLGTDPTVGGTCEKRPAPPDFSIPPDMAVTTPFDASAVD